MHVEGETIPVALAGMLIEEFPDPDYGTLASFTKLSDDASIDFLYDDGIKRCTWWLRREENGKLTKRMITNIEHQGMQLILTLAPGADGCFDLYVLDVKS